MAKVFFIEAMPKSDQIRDLPPCSLSPDEIQRLAAMKQAESGADAGEIEIDSVYYCKWSYKEPDQGEKTS